MSKYIDVEKLKAEINKRREYLKRYVEISESADAMYDELSEVLNIIDSLQQEQPINTDNLCSELADYLIRNDIQEEKAKFLANRILDLYGSKKYLEGLCDGIKQKQPDADLEKALNELDNAYFDLDGIAVAGATYYLTVNDLKDIARDFYERGFRRAAEMYDDIEYNRQRAEESLGLSDLKKL